MSKEERASDGQGDYSIGSDKWPGLSKLIEECGEVLQVAGKIMGTGGNVNHWDGTKLDERLEEELADLQAAVWFVQDHCSQHRIRINNRAVVKLKMFNEWHDSDPLQ